MSDVEGLLALYGALDRAVDAHEVDPADIAPLLGAYRYPETVGWYEHQYRPWVEGAAARAERRGERRKAAGRRPRITVRHRGEDPVPPEPVATESPIQEIRAALAFLGPAPLEGRTAARRLLAITVLARALPQHFGPDGSDADLARDALIFRIPGEDSDNDSLAQRAQELHAQFANEFTDMGQWPNVVANAVRSGLLPQSFLSQQAAPPCTGKLIMRPTSPGGDPDPCLVMEAEFTTQSLTFEEAKVYLEPANWQYPGSLWCRMEGYDSPQPNSRLYHETVSTACESTSPAWTVSTDLQFWFSHPTPTEARAEYDFAPGLPVPGSDIEIDEGSLRIIKLPDGSVNVKTTKRVRFAGSFDGPGLAMFMCASGYSTILEDVVFSVAKAAKPQPFPVTAPPGAGMSPPAKSKTPKTPPGSGGDTLDSLIAEAAALAESYAKDVAATCTASLTQVQAGTYKVENAWADGIKIWSSYLTGMGKALDLGTRTAKVVAKQTTE